MSKLNVNEFMIGDWFQTTYPTGKVEFRKVEGVMPNHIVCNNGVTNAIEPIPLTAEILEKNGFLRSKVFVEWKYENDNVYMIYKPFPYLKIETEECNVAFPCEYIHQLQHALRLCGKTHEIVL